MIERLIDCKRPPGLAGINVTVCNFFPVARPKYRFLLAFAAANDPGFVAFERQRDYLQKLLDHPSSGVPDPRVSGAPVDNNKTEPSQ